jgi:hypothetical protein
MSIRVVSPAENARIGHIVREEIAEPMDAIGGSPCFVAVSVQAVDGDDAG